MKRQRTKNPQLSHLLRQTIKIPATVKLDKREAKMIKMGKKRRSERQAE